MPDLLKEMLGRELLRYAVQRQIVCPVTGETLDVRSAVLVDASDHGGQMAVVSAAAWDEHRDVIVGVVGGADHDIYDGREFGH